MKIYLAAHVELKLNHRARLLSLLHKTKWWNDCFTCYDW